MWPFPIPFLVCLLKMFSNSIIIRRNNEFHWANFMYAHDVLYPHSPPSLPPVAADPFLFPTTSLPAPSVAFVLTQEVWLVVLQEYGCPTTEENVFLPTDHELCINTQGRVWGPVSPSPPVTQRWPGWCCAHVVQIIPATVSSKLQLPCCA